MCICRDMAHMYYMREKFPVKKAMPVLHKLPSKDLYFTGTSLLQKLLSIAAFRHCAIKSEMQKV